MYAKAEDLRLLCAEKELVQLARDGQGQGWEHEHVQATLAEAIDQADGEIDAYIGAKVELPLQTVPRLIANLSAKIAVYNLMRRRPSVPDHWESEYKRCLSLLEKIASGKLALGLASDDDKGAGTAFAAPVVIAPEPVFGADTWGKM